ncbi:MAG: BatD family protein [Pseudomonadota bacterium]
MRHVGKSCLLLALFMQASMLQAAVTATTDRSVMTMADTLVLTLQADAGEDISSADLSPLLRNFSIESERSSRSMSIINGRSQSSVKRIIELLPQRVGSLRIPALDVDGVRTHPLVIEVLPAPQGIDSSQDVFVESEVDKDWVYVQSQLIHTFRIYQAIELTDRGRSQLEVADAVVEELDPVVFQRVINGRPYRVIEVKHAVFPQASGEITLPAMSFNGRRELNRSTLFSFGSGEMLRRRSAPITVEVRPVPAGYPDSAWLPASSLRLEESWSSEPDSLTVGDSVTRSFTLIAEGIDASLLPQIEQADVPGVRVYPDQPQTENRPSERGVTGTATSTAALLITEPGQFTLPPVRLPWWDTTKDTLRYAELPARTITVKGAPASAGDTPAGAVAFEAAPKQTGLVMPSTPTSSVANPWMWSTLAAMFGWLLTLLWLLIRKGAADTKPDTARSDITANESTLFTAFAKSCKSNHATEARGHLRSWARLKMGWQRRPTLAEIAAAFDSDSLSTELTTLDSALYSNAAATEWRGSALLAAVTALRKTSLQGKGARPALPPLYSSHA